MKIVVILSGGIDSTTLVYDLFKQGYEISCLGFNYGQRYKKELDYAKRTCELLNVTYRGIDISTIHELLRTSNMPVPEGHYTEENIKVLTTPNRNLIFLALASAYAISRKIEKIYYGAHTGNHTIYPDCKLEFVKAVNKVIKEGNWKKAKIMAPYIKMNKADIIKKGLELGVPYENTWSCYKGEDRPCLKCGTCIERIEAFYQNNVKDPLLTDEEWKRAVEYIKKGK